MPIVARMRLMPGTTVLQARNDKNAHNLGKKGHLSGLALAFDHDFEYNKHKVGEYTDIQNKDIRNRIAGYVTRKMRKGA